MIPAAANEWTRGANPDPAVPVKSRRNGIGAVGHRAGIAPFLTAPGVNFFHFANGAILDEAHGKAIFGVGMDLNAHLRDDLLPAGDFRKAACLVNVVRERLLTINVEAAVQRAHSNG